MTVLAIDWQVRVPPRHCDAQGMLHASRPYEYFEDAFLTWIDAAGGGYAALRAAGYDFVIVESRCSYLQPARLDDRLTIQVRPVTAGKSAFTARFDVRRAGTALAVGRATYVMAREGQPAEIPPILRTALHGLPPGGRDIDRTMAAGLLHRLHKAQEWFYAGGDSAPLRAVLDPAVCWHVPGRNAIAGEYDGIDAVLRYMALRRDHADASLRLHPGELLVGNHDYIASLTDGSAVIDGTEQRWSTVGLYRMHTDRIVECRLLPLDPEGFDRIWVVRDGESGRHRHRRPANTSPVPRDDEGHGADR